MAKQTPPSAPSVTTTVDFVMLKVTGDAGTIAKSIESLIQTLRQPTGRPLTTSGLVRPTFADQSSHTEAVDNSSLDVIANDDESPMGAAGDEIINTPATPTRKRAPAKAPLLVDDLDMEGQPTPFAAFIASTTLNKDSAIGDKAIVIATWLRDHRQRPDIGPRELYTVCKLMDWDPPTDTTSPMRNLKREDKMRSTKRGRFELTLVGDKHYKTLRTT
jgi:hypothetical protein